MTVPRQAVLAWQAARPESAYSTRATRTLRPDIAGEFESRNEGKWGAKWISLLRFCHDAESSRELSHAVAQALCITRPRSRSIALEIRWITRSFCISFSKLAHKVRTVRGWSIRVLTPPTVKLSRIRCKLIHPRPLPKSLEMDRQFPPEIIQLIVEASLDPYDVFNLDWFKAKRRYKILTKYSLLNWTWQVASAPSLHELVVISTKGQALSFLVLLEANGGSSEECET